MPRFVSVVASLLSLFAIGCGESGPATYPVTGTVTLDGRPIPHGDIRLIPLDVTQSSEAGPIHQGKFSLRSKVGKMKVDIRASRETGRTTQGAMGEAIPETEQYVPARYNSQSNLEITVESDGNAEFTFDLTSD